MRAIRDHLGASTLYMRAYKGKRINQNRASHGRKTVRTDTKVGIDGGEQASTDAMMLSLFIGNMRTRTRIPEFFGESKIDDVDKERGVFVKFGDDEIGRLNVAVDEVARMHVLYTRELGANSVSLAFWNCR